MKDHLTKDMKNTPALIKLEDAYRRLGVTPKSFRGLVRHGHLPQPLKVSGRRYLFPAAALEAFLAKLTGTNG